MKFLKSLFSNDGNEEIKKIPTKGKGGSFEFSKNLKGDESVILGSDTSKPTYNNPERDFYSLPISPIFYDVYRYKFDNDLKFKERNKKYGSNITYPSKIENIYEQDFFKKTKDFNFLKFCQEGDKQDLEKCKKIVFTEAVTCIALKLSWRKAVCEDVYRIFPFLRRFDFLRNGLFNFSEKPSNCWEVSLISLSKGSVYPYAHLPHYIRLIDELDDYLFSYVNFFDFLFFNSVDLFYFIDEFYLNNKDKISREEKAWFDETFLDLGLWSLSIKGNNENYIKDNVLHLPSFYNNQLPSKLSGFLCYLIVNLKKLDSHFLIPLIEKIKSLKLLNLCGNNIV